MDNLPFFLKYIKKILAIIILLAVIFIIFLTIHENNPINKANSDIRPKITEISINNNIIIAEVVDTADLMARGLSGRSGLNENEGMWFVFAKDGNYGFWMKDMNFPIDIIWFDKDFKIVYLQKNILPETYPTVFYPNADSRYVLEVNAGFSEKHKIKIGDQAKVPVGDVLKD